MHGLKIGHYNIRSMTSQKKFDSLYDMVKLFDIFCVSESWLTDSYPSNKLQIPNSTSYRLDRVADKVGGGLLLYTKNRFSPYCTIIDTLSVSTADVELLVLNYTEDKHRLMTKSMHTTHPKGAMPSV